MIDAPYAYAFTVGMLATVNPCGFAMLPAYLSFFLGLERGGPAPAGSGAGAAAAARALVVGLTVSLGFLVVFAAIGTLTKVGLDSFIGWVQWATVAIGVGLVVLGVAMVAGYHLPVSTPRLDRGGRTRSLGSVFVFGVSYAVASIGCALPLFFAAVFGTVARAGVVSGLAAFAAYSAGMAVVLTALTVALAFARESFVQALRSAMRHVDRVAGVFLIVAGAYLAYYWTSLKTGDLGSTPGPVHFVEVRATRVQNWVLEQGAGRIGLALAALIALAVVVALGARRRVRRAEAPGVR